MFKCQEGYTLRKIKGVSYILPFGQQIADQRKGTILNETSAFLWNVIQHNEGADLEMLTEMLARRYGLAEEDFPMLREDILDFLRQLQSMGMLTETLRLQSEEASLCILIAGLRLLRKMQTRKLSFLQLRQPANLMEKSSFAIQI